MASSEDAYVIEDDSIDDGSPMGDDGRRESPKRRPVDADLGDHGSPRTKVSRRTDDDDVGVGSGRGVGLDCEVVGVEGDTGAGSSREDRKNGKQERQKIDLTASPKGGHNGGAEWGAGRSFSGGSDVVEMIDDSLDQGDGASDSSAVSSKSIDYGGASSSSYQRAKPPSPPQAREPARPQRPSIGGHSDEVLILDSPMIARPANGDVFQVEQGEDGEESVSIRMGGRGEGGRAGGAGPGGGRQSAGGADDVQESGETVKP